MADEAITDISLISYLGEDNDTRAPKISSYHPLLML